MDEKFKKASDLADAGDLQAARLLILELVQENPRHAQAWSALIQLAETDTERRQAIYHFWALDSKNPEAIRLLKQAKSGKLPPIQEKIGLSSRNYVPKIPRIPFWKKFHFLIFLLLIFTVFPSQAQTVACIGSLPSRLVVGQQARSIAEGGSNFRAVPNSGGTLLNIIPQNELIPVIDGPYCAEGIAWWQIDYQGERGWIAEGLGEFYWLEPYIVQQAQIGTIRLETLPDFASHISGERLGEPLRSQFVLEGFAVTSPLLTPFIVIFDEISAEQSRVFERVRNRDSAAKHLALETNQLTGWRFVEIYAPQRIEETVLVYHFMGMSADNRFIDAYFPLTAPNLPLLYDPANLNYLEDNQELIDKLALDEIQPALGQLDLLIQSLRFDAPLDESDLLHYEEGGISFDYNPMLAYEILQTVEFDSTAAYINLEMRGYPLDGEVNFRIYRAEDLQGGDLAGFQQTLSRHPNNPPQMPLQAERPAVMDNLQYMRFANGDGLRYLSAATYHFYGLSDNRAYYLLLELPILDDNPPLFLLDALVTSLQVGG